MRKIAKALQRGSLIITQIYKGRYHYALWGLCCLSVLNGRMRCTLQQEHHGLFQGSKSTHFCLKIYWFIRRYSFFIYAQYSTSDAPRSLMDTSFNTVEIRRCVSVITSYSPEEGGSPAFYGFKSEMSKPSGLSEYNWNMKVFFPEGPFDNFYCLTAFCNRSYCSCIEYFLWR